MGKENVILRGMETVGTISSINWTIVLCFVCAFLLLVCAIFHMILHDFRQKQNIYKKFGDHINEYIVVLSQRMDFLYGLPMFMEDPLFNRLKQGQLFRDMLETKDWNRLKQFFEEIEKHYDMPFVFSIKDSESQIYWYELRSFVRHISSMESNYVCFIKNITKELEIRRECEDVSSNLSSLLQNTGDFLWNIDLDNRKLNLLTPLMDEEHREIPQSVGVVDMESMMPKADCGMLNRVIDNHILAYRQNGLENESLDTVKLRIYGPDKMLVWYSFCGKLVLDDVGNLVFQGTARRMDLVLENPNVRGVEESILSAAFSFPDFRVFWLDKDYKIVRCNQTFATDFLIANPDDVKDKTLDQVVKPKYLSYFNKIVSDVFASGRSAAWKGIFDSPDRYLMYNVTPIKDSEGKLLYVMGSYILLESSELDTKLK